MNPRKIFAFPRTQHSWNLDTRPEIPLDSRPHGKILKTREVLKRGSTLQSKAGESRSESKTRRQGKARRESESCAEGEAREAQSQPGAHAPGAA